jgi:acyl-[acyl-carrier-protein] desaturase
MHGKNVDSYVDQYLYCWKIWQPSDFYQTQRVITFEEVKELREIAKDLPYDFGWL